MSIFVIMVSETFKGVDTEGFENFSDFAEMNRKKERKNSTGAGIFYFRIFILSPQSLGRERRMTSDSPRRKSLAAVP